MQLGELFGWWAVWMVGQWRVAGGDSLSVWAGPTSNVNVAMIVIEIHCMIHTERSIVCICIDRDS